MTTPQLTPAEVEAYRQFPVNPAKIPFDNYDLNEERRNIFLSAVKWREESRWQDISTAPKDGTKVDLWYDSSGRECDAFFEVKDGRWVACYRGMPCFRTTQPTHWMPLPPSPIKHS